MTPIQAIDVADFAYPLEAVWQLLVDVENYPNWWPPSLGVRALSSGQRPLGAELEIRPKGGRPFRCRVFSMEPQVALDMEYFGGFIVGAGHWQLETLGDITRVSYRIDVRAEGWLVRWIAKVVDLGAIHSRQMRQVFDAMQQALRLRSGCAAY